MEERLLPAPKLDRPCRENHSFPFLEIAGWTQRLSIHNIRWTSYRPGDDVVGMKALGEWRTARLADTASRDEKIDSLCSVEQPSGIGHIDLTCLSVPPSPAAAPSRSPRRPDSPAGLPRPATGTTTRPNPAARRTPSPP